MSNKKTFKFDTWQFTFVGKKIPEFDIMKRTMLDLNFKAAGVHKESPFNSKQAYIDAIAKVYNAEAISWKSNGMSEWEKRKLAEK